MALATVSTAMAAVGSPRQPAVALVGAPDGDWARRWGVVEHWAGTAVPRLASISSANSMTAVNVPTTVAGLVYPTAEHYTAASSQYDSLADNAAVSAGDIDLLLAAWVYLDSTSATYRQIAGKNTGIPATSEYSLYKSNANKFVFFMEKSTESVATANTFGTVTTGGWHLVVGFHDAVNDLIGISVDGGAYDTAAATAGGMNDTATAFNIGSQASGALYWDGRIGPVTLCKSPPLGIATLKTEIRDRLWNGGAGRVWPFR